MIEPEQILFLLVMFAAVLLQGLFVGTEMALTALDRGRLRRAVAANRGGRIFRWLLKALEDPTWTLGTALLGVNFALTLLATTLVFTFAETWGLWLIPMALLALPFTLLFGDILPKSWFQAHAMQWASRLIAPLLVLAFIAKPWLAVMAWLNRLMTRQSSNDPQTRPFVLREELKHRIEDLSSTPELGAMERQMITRIFNFRETTVQEVMMPLIDVQAVSDSQTLKQAIEVMTEQGHSRLPVCRHRVDNVIGLLYAFDVLYETDLDKPLKPFIRKAYYVPAAMPISKLLVELRKKHAGMAVVVDEYGGAEGIVTLEDVLEEIVGDIEDEYDRPHQNWRRKGPHEYILNARLDLDILEELVGTELPHGNYETVAGFMLSVLGYIPEVGDSLSHGPLRFTVTKTSERSVREVQLLIKASNLD